MKLVLTLLVRDEEDILDAHMSYHLARGVDFILVTDNRSKDRTATIVKRYQRAGVAKLLHEPGDDYSQGEWVTRMARMASEELAADWVIPSDADEFWWPDSGDLKSTLAGLPPEVGVVSVPRFNFVVVEDDGLPFYERMVVRERVSFSVFGRPLLPKVCHRGHRDITVMQGNHGVEGADLVELEGNAPLQILHFPLRRYSQFANKIVNGGRAYQRNTDLPPTAGDAWRYLYGLYRQGVLSDYYAKQEKSAGEIGRGLRTGQYVFDDRLRECLALLHQGRLEPVARSKECPSRRE